MGKEEREKTADGPEIHAEQRQGAVNDQPAAGKYNDLRSVGKAVSYEALTARSLLTA